MLHQIPVAILEEEVRVLTIKRMNLGKKFVFKKDIALLPEKK